MAFRNIQLKHLEFLEPKVENLAPNSTFYPEDIFPEQMPYLWPCDEVGGKDKDKFGMNIQSPSLVFDVSKRAESSFKSTYNQNKDRLRLLGVLKKVLDAYQIGSPTFGAELVPDHQKRLKQLNDLYQKNLETTQSLVALWEPLLKSAADIRQAVKQLVVEEARLGKKSGKCANAQVDLNDFLLLGKLPQNIPADVGDYFSYDEVLPRGMVISPYACANLAKNRAGETDSELYMWLDLLEKVMTEHVFVSMDRQRAYIENADRATGAVGSGNDKKRAALNSVFAVQAENQKALEQWKSMIVRVQELKAKAFEAINQETKMAKKLKRCARHNKPEAPAQPSGDTD